VVKDYITQLIQSTYRNGIDVADSLRLMSEVDLNGKILIRKVSRKTDPEEKNKNKSHSMRYLKQRLRITY
jgi:hypothetical protein